jgi:radical SAM protein with 4Fe4S-binding SPASM domain
MLEFFKGVEFYAKHGKKVFISPHLNQVILSSELNCNSKDLTNLPKAVIERFKTSGIINESHKIIKKSLWLKKLLIDSITIKDLDPEKIVFVFKEFIKNSSFDPDITIDSSLENTKSLLKLIVTKFNQNSINPTIKIFIRENLEEYIDAISNYITKKESIELNNIILVIDEGIFNLEKILKIDKLLNPLEIYKYKENINFLDPNFLHSNYNYPLLLDLNEKTSKLKIQNIVDNPIFINDDSIFRFLAFIRNRIDLITIHHDILPYIDKNIVDLIFLDSCKACGNKILIDGPGDLYTCELGYKVGDKLGNLNETSLNDFLHSERCESIRKKINKKFSACGKDCCLIKLCSGCIYSDKFDKCTIMRNLLEYLLNNENGEE